MNMRVTDTPGQNPVQDILDNSVVEQAKQAKLMGDPSVTVDGAKGSKSDAAPLTLHDLLPPPDAGSLQRVATASQPPAGSTDVTEGSTQTTSSNPYQQKLGPDAAVDATAGLMAAMRASITQQNMSAEDDENTRESNLNAYEGQMKASIKQINDQASDIWKAALTNGICGFAAGAMSIGGSLSGAAGLTSGDTIADNDAELAGITGDDQTDMNTNIDDELTDEDDIGKNTNEDGDEKLSEDPLSNSESSEENEIKESAVENEQSEEKTGKTEAKDEKAGDEKTDAQKKTEAVDKNTKAREEQMKESQRSQKWQQRQMRLQGLSQMMGSGGQAGGAGFTTAQTRHTGEEKQDEAQAQQLMTASQNENEFKQTNRSNINQTIQSMGSVLSTLADAKLTTAKA